MNKVALAFFGLVLLALIKIAFIYYLWNWLMPIIFGLPVITVWQSWGLMVLTAALFNFTDKISSDKS